MFMAFGQNFHEPAGLTPRVEVCVAASAQNLQIASGYENCQHANKYVGCLPLLVFLGRRFYMN
jgi:hypothetical protein